MSASRRLLLVTSLLAATARADDADVVVVHVGAAALKVTDVARRLSALPPYQLETLGPTSEAVRRTFVETVLVPESLLSSEAERRGLANDPRVKARISDVLRRVLIESLHREAAATGIPDAEVRAYYDAHPDDYHVPERLRLARILVDDAESARKILSEVRGPKAASRWSDLARELSLDEATKMRGGALGFVHPDGRTDVPQLAVDKGLFVAASRVKDGELVPEPVHEGTRLAVVWRRGSLPAIERSFEGEAPRIREMLLRERVDRAVHKLLAELRARDLHFVDATPLETWTPEAAPSGAPRASGSFSSAPTAVDPVPRDTPRGLR